MFQKKGRLRVQSERKKYVIRQISILLKSLRAFCKTKEEEAIGGWEIPQNENNILALWYKWKETLH